jgi:hypothetical protein
LTRAAAASLFGSLATRLQLQNICPQFILIADLRALAGVLDEVRDVFELQRAMRHVG